MMPRRLLLLPALALACSDPSGGTATLGGSSGSGDEPTGSTSGQTTQTTHSSHTSAETTGGDSDGGSTGSPTTTDATTTTTSTTGPTTDTDTGGPDKVRCGDTPPDGAQLAPEIPAYAGTCPVIETGYMDGQAYNTISQTVDGQNFERQFLVIVPDDMQPDEKLPILFMWHWLGGDAKGFYDRADTQNAVNQKRFIAVIPEAREGVLFKWPFSALDSESSLEAEFQFFDDMLSCVNEQFNLDKECVSSVGVSAGALFTSQLAGGRGDRLASFMSLSGGTGGGTVKEWTAPRHKMPAMVLWGGEDDFCIVIDFQQTSQNLEMHLEQGGHFIFECIHNCNHSTPPFEAPPGETAFSPMWDFFLDHPYWLETGESPYNEFGVPASMPDWCAIGAGNATPPPEPCDKDECS
jgi:predicted esterase